MLFAPMHRSGLLLCALFMHAGCGDSASSTAGAGGSAGSAGAASLECPSNLPTAADCSGTPPTYASDIAPLISARCLACHYAGNTMSSVVLADYASVYKNRSVALTQVYRCSMPPSTATPLSAQERLALLQYFVCGAPND